VKITLKGVLGVVRALLPFLPGGDNSPHASVGVGRLFAAANPAAAQTPGGLVPVSGFAVNIDANFLAQIDGAGEIAKVIDPSNAVLFIASGDSANALRAVLGLSPTPTVSGP
jgi:hypothetical protein